MQKHTQEIKGESGMSKKPIGCEHFWELLREQFKDGKVSWIFYCHYCLEMQENRDDGKAWKVVK